MSLLGALFKGTGAERYEYYVVVEEFLSSHENNDVISVMRNDGRTERWGLPFFLKYTRRIDDDRKGNR